MLFIMIVLNMTALRLVFGYLKMVRLSTMVTAAILTGLLLAALTAKKEAVLSISIKDSNLSVKSLPIHRQTF